MPKTPALLSARNITRKYGERKAVDDLSLRLEAGAVKSLLGASGCGKSTTLRILAGLERQDSGQIDQDGRRVSDDSCHEPPERRAIGFMFQDFALFPHLTALGNVMFGLTGPAKEARRRAEALLERVGLSGFGDTYPYQLSGGEQQRVALARALAPAPKILLMDEPFSGLDDRLRDGVRDESLAIIRESGAAVLIVTHAPGEAMRVADEILLMRDGRIVQKGNPLSIFTRPVDKEAAGFFTDLNVISGVAREAAVDTPFGRFLAPKVSDGQRVEVVVRPQHIKMDFDRGGKGPAPTAENGVPARGIVKRARYMGTHSLVEFRMESDGTPLKATVPAVFLPAEGRRLWISLRRADCFVFPAG